MGKGRCPRSKGYIDAIFVSGKEHGCVETPVDPDAPYRVIGFDFECQNFDIPFHSLFLAVRAMIRLERDLSTVVFVDKSETAGISDIHKRVDEIVRRAW